MAIAVNHQLFTGGWGSPKLDLGGCLLYAPLWRPDQAGSPFNSKPPVPQTLTVTGAVWGSTGRTFVGSDDLIELTAAALNFTTSDFSVFGWFNPTTISGATRILVIRGLLNTDGWHFHYSAAGSLVIATNQAAATQQSMSAGGQVVTGSWQFLGGTRSGAVGKVYKNATDITDTSASHINPTTSSRTVKLGVYDDKAQYWYLGVMGEVLVYNRALTQSEISRIYQATKGRYT